MAFAPLSEVDKKNVHGCFYHFNGNHFEFSNCSDMPKGWEQFDKKIYVGDGNQTRYAQLLKTVAYVVVDEDENGSPVVEKWYIKGHRQYELSSSNSIE